MADYITKIKTKDGDKQIDYNSLANKPQSDTTLNQSGKFADAKAVGDSLAKKLDSPTSAGTTGQVLTKTPTGQQWQTPAASTEDVEQIETNKGNITTLQGKVNALESEMDTAQADITELESNIGTLTSKMSTAESDIDNLQSAQSTMNTTLQGKLDATGVDNKIKEVAPFVDASFDTSGEDTNKLVLSKYGGGTKEVLIPFDQIATEHYDPILENYFALRRTGKIYQTKIWKYSTNPSPTGEKLADNQGLVFEPSTDTDEGQDDYAGIPLFDWWHCNYVRDLHGDPYIKAIKGQKKYAETGSVDVGAFGMTFYWGIDTSNEGYEIWTISDSPHPELSLVPWVESVRADGTIAPYWCHSAYFSGLASDELPRSQPNLKPIRNVSHDNMITSYQAKGAGYWGAGASRNLFQIIFNVIMGGTKSSQTIYGGVTNYSFQYSASVERSDNQTYFPVTNAQAANILVGNYVSVGYGRKTSDGTISLDRSYAEVHQYADDVKVLKVETLDENNKAVYLDIKEGFNTTPVQLEEGLTAPITISSMHTWSGTTDRVIGKHNGSPVSNTDNKHPYRVQGTEYACGFYVVSSDTLINWIGNGVGDVYVAYPHHPHYNGQQKVAQIKKEYKKIGSIPTHTNMENTYFYIGDIDVDVETGSWHTSSESTSLSQGWGDTQYVVNSTASTMYEYLMAGYLGRGSNAGACCVHGGYSSAYAFWHLGGCD